MSAECSETTDWHRRGVGSSMKMCLRGKGHTVICIVGSLECRDERLTSVVVVGMAVDVLVQDIDHRLLWPGSIASIIEREEEIKASSASGIKRQFVLRLISLIIGCVEGKGPDMSRLCKRDLIRPVSQSIVYRIGDLSDVSLLSK